MTLTHCGSLVGDNVASMLNLVYTRCDDRECELEMRIDRSQEMAQMGVVSMGTGVWKEMDVVYNGDAVAEVCHLGDSVKQA